MQVLAPLQKDAYKIYHPSAYPPGTEHVHSNITNRFGKYTNVPNNTKVMNLGIQFFILEVLIKEWNETFFAINKKRAIKEYLRVVEGILGNKVDASHLEALHDLGYLPLEVRALPEGVLVPYGVPHVTIDSNVKGMGWLVNAIETVLSSEICGISTSATTAYAYRKRFEQEPLLKKYASIKHMGHDFSFRGMIFGRMGAAMSGFGHLASFIGSDTIPAGLFAEKYYGADISLGNVLNSVDSTEHSVACSNIIVETEIAQKEIDNGRTLEELWKAL